MSRLYDYVLIGVVSLISYIIHTIGIVLFAPESELHEIASDAVVFGGAEKADLWYQALAIWVPLIAVGGIVVYAVLREYRRQARTAAVAPR